MKQNLNTIRNAFHHLQKERGVTSLYLIDKKTLTIKNLLSYFKKTNKKCQELIKYIHTVGKLKQLDADEKQLLDDILLNLSQLENHRQLIIDKKIILSKSFDYYTYSLISLIIRLTNITLIERKLHPRILNAYCFFIQWKERVGIERVVILKGFINKKFYNNEYLEHIEFLLNEQRYYKNSFLSLATIGQKKIINDAYNSYAIRTLHNIHRDFRSGVVSEELLKMSIMDWFDLISKKIDLLYKVEELLINTLNGEHTFSKKTLNNYINTKQNLAYKLDIFKGINNEDIDNIINQGQIYWVPKNKTIILKNSIANHLHIILIGYVEVFKKNDKGKIVLQILKDGNTILDDCIFDNSNFYANAKTINDVLMLSIPASIIKKQMVENSILIKNLFTNTALKLKSIYEEIAILKTKSVDERIGNFLLKLFSQQKNNSNKVILPYNKTIIASQLGVTRESFSRSLKLFEKHHCTIDKNTITTTNKKILCKYCNSEIYDNCNYKFGNIQLNTHQHNI